MNDGSVTLTKVGHIGRLLLNNPSRHNAISPAMAEQLIAGLAELDSDPTIRLVVLAGAGDKAFSSGAEVSNNAAGNQGAKNSGMQSLQLLREFSKPTIASIRGYCLGGGVALACACDLRVCSADAKFAVPSARMGLAYRIDFTQWLMEAVGASLAKEMLFTGQRYSADDAQRIGLVHRVVPSTDLDTAVDALCQTIAQNAPLATAASKVIINQLARGAANMEFGRCEQLVADCEASSDRAEGKRAFTEKRPPVFQGR
ncbi:MAG: enoyl-CoA hydratase-related protein [Steroidobacteraceae bacterium]